MLGYELSDRERAILLAIVGQYIASGEPVSSRALSRMEKFSWSSATLRNIMADLEEAGYLTRTHASSGRIPADKGYRFYVETLLREGFHIPPNKRILKDIEDVMQVEEVFRKTPKELAELSHRIGLFLAPHFGYIIIKSIHFIPLSSQKILAVLVARSGNVLNKTIQVDRPYRYEELVQFGNFLSSSFSGKTLWQITRELEEKMQSGLKEYSLSKKVVTSLATKEAELLLEAGSYKDTYATIQDKLKQSRKEHQRLIHLLHHCVKEDTTVIIGSDDSFTEHYSCALVAARYSLGSMEGAVGVLGEKAMPYKEIIPLVQQAARVVEKKLNKDWDKEESDGR